MPNNLGQNPWVIDTAGATVLWSSRVSVRHIEFAGYTADTDRCVVKNAQGLIIMVLDGAADLETVRSGNVGWVSGIAVTTLDGGGICRIFID